MWYIVMCGLKGVNMGYIVVENVSINIEIKIDSMDYGFDSLRSSAEDIINYYMILWICWMTSIMIF